MEPTNRVTGPGSGAIDCREETEDVAEDGGELWSFRPPVLFNFQSLYSNQMCCVRMECVLPGV